MRTLSKILVARMQVLERLSQIPLQEAVFAEEEEETEQFIQVAIMKPS
jgi:hypothetical protein